MGDLETMRRRLSLGGSFTDEDDSSFPPSSAGKLNAIPLAFSGIIAQNCINQFEQRSVSAKPIKHIIHSFSSFSFKQTKRDFSI